MITLLNLHKKIDFLPDISLNACLYRSSLSDTESVTLLSDMFVCVSAM